jgi:cell division protein FtsB
MRREKKKNIFKEKVLQFFLLIFTLFFIVFLVLSNLKLERKKREISQQIEDLKLKIEELEEKKKKLEEAIFQTQNKNYWEELAREEGYVKEGEEAIVIKKVEEEREKTKEEEKIWLKIFEEIKNLFRK